MIQVDPYMPEYHSELARCYASCDEYESAIACLEQAYGLDQAIPETAAVMAFCYLRLNDLEMANTWYRKALNAAIDTEGLTYDSAFVLGSLGRWDECLNRLKQHQLKYGEYSLTPDAYALMAESYLKNSSVSEALECLRRGLTNHPGDKSLEENISLVQSLNSARA